MSTTSLFVELIVIGASVFIWLLLFAGAFIGFDLSQLDNTLLISSAIPTLAVIYVLGIISDRLADNLFDKYWGESLKAEYFEDTGEYYNARRNILINSPALSDLLEYGRSRLRICRGWALNTLLICLALNIFLWRRSELFAQPVEIAILGSLACILLSVGAWFSWRNLTRVEYRKIRDQSRYLSDQLGRGGQ